MATDPYEALQDDLEAMSLANAGLLVEVAERASSMEQARAVRATLADEADDLLVGREIWTGDPETRARYETLRYAVALLDDVEGL